jgi:hypothetical protein
VFWGQFSQVNVILSQTMKNESYYLYLDLADPIDKIIFHVV